jgi:hypothetical protein
MDRFQAPTIDDDRRDFGLDRRQRMRREQGRIVTALIALDDWAWSQVRAEDYDGLSDADVDHAAGKADRLSAVVAACIEGPPP